MRQSIINTDKILSSIWRHWDTTFPMSQIAFLIEILITLRPFKLKIVYFAGKYFEKQKKMEYFTLKNGKNREQNINALEV